MKQKKLFLIILNLILGITVNAQTIIHTVKKGETIESISKLYNVSVENLRKDNPAAAKFIYVGQQLKINPEQHIAENKPASLPEPPAEKKNIAAVVKSVVETPALANQPEQKGNSRANTFEPTAFVGFILPVQSWSNSIFGLGGDFEFGEKYWITESAYCKALIGYNFVGSSMKNYEQKHVFWRHNVVLPVLFGISLGDADGFGINFGGFVQFAFAGVDKIKEKGTVISKTRLKDSGEQRFSYGMQFGVKVGSFDIGARLAWANGAKKPEFLMTLGIAL